MLWWSASMIWWKLLRSAEVGVAAKAGGCEAAWLFYGWSRGRVGTLMKPANHRSTEMHSSLRILPSVTLGRPAPV